VDPCAATGGVCTDPIRINELLAENTGAWIDEALETDDYIEIINAGTAPQSLLGYAISDDPNTFTFLPARTLLPGELLLLWADKTPSQGRAHLPFKLSNTGETLYLWAPDGRLVDRVTYEHLGSDMSLQRIPSAVGSFTVCSFATPNRDNGDHCGPPPVVEPPPEVTFTPYLWPEPFPRVPSPLALNELALRPASFIEVLNTSASTVALDAFALTVAPLRPGETWPTFDAGVPVPLPAGNLNAGDTLAISLDAAVTLALAEDPNFEGVVTLWRLSDETVIDRADFMAWPDGAALSRTTDTSQRWHFCATLSPNNPNTACEPLPSRPLMDRVHHLYTPGDFAALAQGGLALGMESVKFVVDMQAGDITHFLSSTAWDLHYTFIREQIDHAAHLNRCDPTEEQAFLAGWGAFSQREYFEVETRRYLLGTLEHYVGSDTHTLEFTLGDRINGAQMLHAFFTVTAHTPTPMLYALRPQSPAQVSVMLGIDGQAPMVDTGMPFRGVTLQPLTLGLAYGILSFVPATELDTTELGIGVVVVTDSVPNDIPFVGGLITEAFQTPLAHVNVLSRNRNTPNLALLDAHRDPRIAPFLGTLVRFEVTEAGFSLAAADPVEAEAFWESRTAQGPPLVARLDTSVRGLQSLTDCSLADLPVIGAKAAGLAELAHVASTDPVCPGGVTTPSSPFAIPVVHSLEHYAQSRAAARLTELEADPAFRTDARVRAQGLAEVQQLILTHPVEPTLLAAVQAEIQARFGNNRVKLRSSSNTEDLPGFNGAGLYTSFGASLTSADDPVEAALRGVWASLYNARAYEERRFFNIDESSVAMGVLIHGAFQAERANGVAISRDIYDPTRSDHYSINSQVGEASVTNPAPGISTEQVLYRWGRTPKLQILTHSNLPNTVPTLSDVEFDRLACTLRAIHNHFRPLLDPDALNRWFAMDIEFKLMGAERRLVIKQARPYSFGQAEIPSDCREI